ncbi:MAG: hypothetical protein WBC93_23310 [Sulfitobacter sp.]
MSNVVLLNVPRRQTVSDRAAKLTNGFASTRRTPQDVYWLKENAELLNILECTGTGIDSDALRPFEAFYDTIEDRLSFFPQYYRFLLSMTLDLEDLGLPGQRGEALCHHIARDGLDAAELSDLQRAEAQRLLARRGVEPRGPDTGLTDRLHDFISQPVTFAIPNKKAAYELTHIVFYLSEYGRRDPQISAEVVTSLEYAGLSAYLDQNADLLAEICVALRYSGHTPSAIWEDWVMQTLSQFQISNMPDAPLMDGYHTYFVSSWLAAMTDQTPFPCQVPEGQISVPHPLVETSALRGMSACLFEMGGNRSADWGVMRSEVVDAMHPHTYDILEDAERSSDRFAEFFAQFSRARAG